jgi:hypothetical protein
MTALAYQPSGPEMGVPRRIAVSTIGVDSEYQRDLDMNRVQKMVREWDPRRCDPLHLSARGGRLWCIDGQHRLVCMRELGIEFCQAFVHEGMTKMEEADFFALKQYGSKTLTVWDLFKAEKVAGKTDVLTIIRIVQRSGFTLSRATGFNHIGAIGALRRILKLGGDRLLTLTLEMVGKLWASADGEHRSIARQGIILQGLAIFLHSFQTEPQYNQDHTAQVLEKNSPGKFLRAAQDIAMSNHTAKSSAVNVALAIRNAYNAGLRPERKLSQVKQLRRSGHTRTRG